MAKLNEGPAFARSALREPDVTVDTPNGVVHSSGQGPCDWYRTRVDTLTKKWIPDVWSKGNRTGE